MTRDEFLKKYLTVVGKDAAIAEHNEAFIKKYLTQVGCPAGSTDEIRYTAASKVTPYATNVFGANYLPDESTFDSETGEGVLKFDGDVTSIGNQAFGGCTQLTSIEIPNSVTSIGNHAFSECSGLTSVKIPNSVTSIETSAFYYCIGLTSITIPSSVKIIGIGAFRNCSSLILLSVEAGNTVYDSRNNCNAIIETSTNTLISGCQNTIIPNNVTSIGPYAFADCTNLTSITIPNSVTSIGYNAFLQCTGLTFVTIPNNVVSIGNRAFMAAYNLKFIKCNSTTPPTIGDSSFEFVPIYVPTESVEIYKNTWAVYAEVINGMPDYILFLNDNTIVATSDIEQDIPTYRDMVVGVFINDSVTSIGNHAFESCSSLTSVTIPNSVTSIGNSAFRECTGLTSVTIPNSVTSIGDDAFESCSSLTSVTIPNSVTSIGNHAFRNCYELVSVTLHNSITAIGEYTFYDDILLTDIIYTGTREQFGSINVYGDGIHPDPLSLLFSKQTTVNCTDGNIIFEAFIDDEGEEEGGEEGGEEE